MVTNIMSNVGKNGYKDKNNVGMNNSKDKE